MAADIFERVAHGRTADAVIVQIERLLLEGVLRAGEKLPGERELAARLEVSRPILREALKDLEARGLLVTRQGGGTSVGDIVGQVFAPQLAELIARHAEATRDYLEYRRAVEGMTAEFAAARATPADCAMLRGIIDAMRAAHDRGDFAEEAALDVEFHNAVGECAHNLVLLHTLRACYRLLSDGVFYNRSLIYGMREARDRLLEQHEAIAKAVIAADRQAARRAAEDHIDFVATAMKEAERTGDWERVARMRLKQRGVGAQCPSSITPNTEAAE